MSMAARMLMMAMTTSSSTSVNARYLRLDEMNFIPVSGLIKAGGGVYSKKKNRPWCSRAVFE
jgi:translation elongation factor EF-1alpha